MMILILYFCVFVFDLFPIIKSKEKKTYWVYAVFFFATFGILLLCSLSVDIPSPAPVIKQVILKMFPNLK